MLLADLLLPHISLTVLGFRLSWLTWLTWCRQGLKYAVWLGCHLWNRSRHICKGLIRAIWGQARRVACCECVSEPQHLPVIPFYCKLESAKSSGLCGSVVQLKNQYFCLSATSIIRLLLCFSLSIQSIRMV